MIPEKLKKFDIFKIIEKVEKTSGIIFSIM